MIHAAVMKIVENAISTWGIVALALVCLLQYAVHVHRMNKARQESNRVKGQLQNLEVEFADVTRDRLLTRLENHILRDFVSQSEIEQAIDVLLRRFVVDQRKGFGVFFRNKPTGIEILASRGLSQQSQKSLTIDDEFLEQIQHGNGLLTLEDAELFHSDLLASLSSNDRQKVRELFLVRMGSTAQSIGALLLTDLYPLGAAREQQLALIKRLMKSLAGNVQRSHDLELHRSQLQLTQEILHLRSITDQKFDTPLQMIEEFLTTLLPMLGMERAALFVNSKGKSQSKQPILQCGAKWPSNLEKVWEQHRAVLCRVNWNSREPQAYDRDRLETIGITTLLDSALVTPLWQGENAYGLLCLTSREPVEVTEHMNGLFHWVSRYLGDLILRVLSNAAVERSARLDGLTQLANRRTFDQTLKREVELAVGSQAPCSLLMIDLDHFKAINDTHGHQIGDEVLRAVAEVLKGQVSHTRSSDRATIARYGGEELAVILPDFNADGALRLAESIRSAVSQIQVKGKTSRSLKVTASFGLSTAPQFADHPTKLIASADAALYLAKQTGRNRVCSADDLLALPGVGEYVQRSMAEHDPVLESAIATAENSR